MSTFFGGRGIDGVRGSQIFFTSDMGNIQQNRGTPVTPFPMEGDVVIDSSTLDVWGYSV